MIKSSLLPPLKPVLLVLFCFPGSVLAVRNLQFASPLQALTIWDHDPETTDPLVNSTARSRFLPKFKAGLDAEMQARKELAAQRQEQLQISATASASGSSSSSSTENDDWANRASAAELQEQIAQEKLIERAYDRAVAPLEQAEAASLALLKAKMNAKQGRSSPAYQFVGVVGRGDCEDEKPITWYARKKPANSHWSVRLLHVNRDAIIKDLFDQGKIDIFGKYKNSGQTNPETGLPVIRSEYSVRKRSWK